jgi:2-oxoglutarate ferredoxin oxidoreductase subunit alpha
MSGTGRARQIWTWGLGKPNTPGPGPSRTWERIADKYEEIARVESRFELDRTGDADILLVSFGTTSVFVDRVVDDLRAEGIRAGSFRPVTLWPFPGDALREATRGCSHVLVYELNAGQLVDDVRMHAADRSVIRSIGGVSQDSFGGVSQDSSGMRQGDLLNANAVRRRVLDAIGLAQGAAS